MKLSATFPVLLALSVGLAGCGDGTNPFTEETTDDSTTDDSTTDDGTTIEDRGLPPGTSSPSADTSITRSEATTEDGGGTALDYRYDGTTDTFYVDNLPFDGDNTYERGTAVSSVGGGAYAVYESDATSIDPDTGNVIDNDDYRVIYGKSTSGQTQFAIVRTGDYTGYGFGGFIYKRNATDGSGDTVSFATPTCSGDCMAEYDGSYAGLRVFSNRGGMEYVQGNATMRVDFADFNEGQTGVALRVLNRRLYDLNGNDVTATYLAALEAVDEDTTITNTGGNTRLPNLISVVSEDNADTNGEIVGQIQSVVVNSDGTVTELDTGNYYAVMSGEDAGEVAGVLVVESDDPRVEGSQVQETGGFILYRQ